LIGYKVSAKQTRIHNFKFKEKDNVIYATSINNDSIVFENETKEQEKPVVVKHSANFEKMRVEISLQEDMARHFSMKTNLIYL